MRIARKTCKPCYICAVGKDSLSSNIARLISTNPKPKGELAPSVLMQSLKKKRKGQSGTTVVSSAQRQPTES